MARYTEDEKKQSLDKLREWLKPGDTVQCILRHKSRSGMSRSISLLAPVGGDILDLDYNVARALGESIDRSHGGIRMGGCGMDMGFALVYNLSRVLFPDGFGCIGDAKGTPRDAVTRCCPSNDHSNGDRDYTPHNKAPSARHNGDGTVTRGHWHSDGGYALRHRWL